MFQQGGMVALLFKLNTVIIAPIIEEISFRGIIFEEAKPLGKVVEFIWPTFVFAAVHGPFHTAAMDGFINRRCLVDGCSLSDQKVTVFSVFHMA